MNKKLIIIIFSLVILISIVVFIGYLQSRKKAPPRVGEVPREITPSPLPIIPSPPKPTPSPATPTPIVDRRESTKYETIINKPILYIALEYPLLYFYDPEEKIIKYFNLDDETYKEIAKIDALQEAQMSLNQEKIIFKVNNEFYVLDLKKDRLTRITLSPKNYGFTQNKIVVYLTDYKNFSHLAYLEENNSTKKIRNIGFFEPEIVFLPPNNLLLYNKEGPSPIFLLNLKNPAKMSLFLEEKNNYSILPNKKGDLIFISYNFESKIINLKKETIRVFEWQTTKEKCSFEEVLVCGVSLDFDYPSWHLFAHNVDDKLIIYDPSKNDYKEIILEEMFDIVQPKLTPSGIVFYNRLDGKIYLIKNE
jgi:hypothetical protein